MTLEVQAFAFEKQRQLCSDPRVGRSKCHWSHLPILRAKQEMSNYVKSLSFIKRCTVAKSCVADGPWPGQDLAPKWDGASYKIIYNTLW